MTILYFFDFLYCKKAAVANCLKMEISVFSNFLNKYFRKHFLKKKSIKSGVCAC